MDIAVKEIHYSFDSQSQNYQIVEGVAEQKVYEAYKEEQEFQQEEYQQMLSDGDVTNREEYLDAIGATALDVDYSKTFEQNKDHPQIQGDIRAKTQQFMQNLHDLPKSAVITVDDQYVDDKGKPDRNAVIAALQQKFGGVGDGVRITGYEAAKEAEKGDYLRQQAYESVTDMMQSHEYQTFLQLRASLQKYSHNNICLIFAQKPDAKAVMGYTAWQQHDRHVDKGQTGISIWMPTKTTMKTEKAIDNYIEKQKSLFPSLYPVLADGTCPRADQKKAKMMAELQAKGFVDEDTGFRLGTVFDVSQTVPNDPTRDNLQDIVNLNKPLDGDLANFDAVMKSIQDAATLANFNMPTGLPQQEAMFEALVSYADHVLANVPEQVRGIKSNEPLTGDMHKIETIMTAYMIAEHIGLETADKAGLKLAEIFDKGKLSEQHISVGRREMFMKAFDRAASLSDMFCKDFDKSFGIDIEAQREAIKAANQERYEQKMAERQAYKESHARFGRMTVHIEDKWKSGKTEYTVGKDETDNKYYIRTVTGKKAEYIKDDDGKAMAFDSQPDRQTAELLLANQHSEQKAAKAQQDIPDDEPEKDSKKKDIEMD